MSDCNGRNGGLAATELLAVGGDVTLQDLVLYKTNGDQMSFCAAGAGSLVVPNGQRVSLKNLWLGTYSRDLYNDYLGQSGAVGLRGRAITGGSLDVFYGSEVDVKAFSIAEGSELAMGMLPVEVWQYEQQRANGISAGAFLFPHVLSGLGYLLASNVPQYFDVSAYELVAVEFLTEAVESIEFRGTMSGATEEGVGETWPDVMAYDAAAGVCAPGFVTGGAESRQFLIDARGLSSLAIEGSTGGYVHVRRYSAFPPDHTPALGRKADGSLAAMQIDDDGALVVSGDGGGGATTPEWDSLGEHVQGSASATSTAAQSIIPAPGAGYKLIIASLQLANGHASTGTGVKFQSASNDITSYLACPPAWSGGNVSLAGFLVCNENEAFRMVCQAGVSTIYCSAQGWKVPV